MSLNVIHPARKTRFVWRLAVGLLVCSVIGLTAYAQFKRPAKREVWGYKVVAQFPHDPNAFTQGLAISNGRLFEGTGKQGESSMRRVDLKTGEIQKIAPLNEYYL